MSSFTSILFPGPQAEPDIDAAPDCFADLHLDEIVAAATIGDINEHLKKFFHAPLHEISTIDYRHRLFHDLEREQTREPIQRFVDGIRTTRREVSRAAKLWHPLQQQGWLAHAVESCCGAITQLRDGLTGVELASQGLQSFFDHVVDYTDSDTFRKLTADTAALHTQLHEVRYTVHIQGLRVHVEKFKDQSDYSVEVVQTFDRFATEVRDDYRVPFENYPDMNHVEEQILECVAKLYPETFSLLAAYCDCNEHFIEPTIARFEREVRCYLAYLEFVHRLGSAGLAFTYPEVTAEPGSLSVENGFDLALAVKSVAADKPVIANDFHLSDVERVLVVTGPNQGGKTTFARTIGQCVYLASLGCPIPARHASVMLPDRIYTHFERQGTLATLHGKFDEELARMNAIADGITPTSLLLCNESFASTNEREGSEIARGIVYAMIESGVKVIYVTHLYDLASSLYARHNPADLFLRAERRPDGARTFRLMPGEPEPTSYGEDSFRRVFGVPAGIRGNHMPAR
ncbi:MutS-related protein [Candidatus Mycobacterium methanotrophicum]|uniref:DNA mismatch repair protein MutS n=1 Tax=Candidatus Mycobacterium methanotrophicum TaxID=2943498 RepID=A0ABY4QIF3_9MYCO|nr:DNA mismatch repair protein MutS [Candidatus Mycobacterium methanotrophicum]UQX09750.1 DNA mismatch repair protein MutS [Candidatus Mycobacterium methanotrophicum]